MVARASLFDPQVFCEITGQARENKYDMFAKQMLWTREHADDKFTTVFMRKMGAFYVKGERGASGYKDRFFKAQTPDEVLMIAKEIWGE